MHLPWKAAPPDPPSRPVFRLLAEFGRLSSAETALLEACRVGEMARAGEDCPAAADEARIVRASFVRFLALGGDAQTSVHEHGVQLRGAWLEGPLDLYAARVERLIELEACRIERINACWATVASMSFSGCRIEHAFEADGLRCSGSLFIRQGTHVGGGAALAGATISGSLYCEGGSFANATPGGAALTCEAAKIDGRVRLDTIEVGPDDSPKTHVFTADGQVNLKNVVIGGTLYCGGGAFRAPDENVLMAEGARIGGDLFLDAGFSATGRVNLLGAKIDGHLVCQRATFSNPDGFALLCDSAQVGRTFVFNNIAAIDGTVSLWNMQVGALNDDGTSWKKAEGRLILDGFTYRALNELTLQSGVAGEQPPTDAQTRIDWLRLQRASDLGDEFRPQPWEQLIKVLRDMGHVNAARDVAIAKQRALGKAGKARSWKRPVRSAFHIIYGELAGFGYKPDRLFWCMLGVWAVYAAIYGWAVHPCAMAWCVGDPLLVPAKPDDAGAAKAIDPLFFSLDVLLPIDLQYAGAWRAADGWAGSLLRWGIGFETILGWLFAGLGVGALGNLIKRD